MKTLLSVKTDVDVKWDAQQTARALGLPLSTVVNALLKDFIRAKQLVLSITPRMSSALESLVGVAIDDYKKKKNVSPIFDNAKDAIRYLHDR